MFQNRARHRRSATSPKHIGWQVKSTFWADNDSPDSSNKLTAMKSLMISPTMKRLSGPSILNHIFLTIDRRENRRWRAPRSRRQGWADGLHSFLFWAQHILYLHRWNGRFRTNWNYRITNSAKSRKAAEAEPSRSIFKSRQQFHAIRPELRDILCRELKDVHVFSRMFHEHSRSSLELARAPNQQESHSQ